MANDIVISGQCGIGSRGFGCNESEYRRAAQALVTEHAAGRHVDTSAYDNGKVMRYFGAATMDELQLKMRNYY